MRITLMHNPKAGDAEYGGKELMAALAKAGHDVTYQSTEKSGYKKELKKPTELVLAAGGDGTVVNVACQLIDTGIPLSVLPLGTANNLARNLGFIDSPEENHRASPRREETHVRHRCGSWPLGHAVFF